MASSACLGKNVNPKMKKLLAGFIDPSFPVAPSPCVRKNLCCRLYGKVLLTISAMWHIMLAHAPPHWVLVTPGMLRYVIKNRVCLKVVTCTDSTACRAAVTSPARPPIPFLFVIHSRLPTDACRGIGNPDATEDTLSAHHASKSSSSSQTSPTRGHLSSSPQEPLQFALL